MRPRDRPHDGEPEARARSVAREPDARLEHALEVGGRDAVPLVGDLDRDRRRRGGPPSRSPRRRPASARSRCRSGCRAPVAAARGRPSTDEPVLRPGDDAEAARERRRLGGIAREAADIEPLGAERDRRCLDEEALDARRALPPRARAAAACRALVRAGIGSPRSRRAPRRGSGSRARRTARPLGSPLIRARSLIRSIAQAAVSASIGSSLPAHSSASGSVVRGADVAERGERVPPQPARSRCAARRGGRPRRSAPPRRA